MRSAQIAAFVLAGCAITPPSTSAPRGDGGLSLPSATGALELPQGSAEVALWSLVQDFARLTGQELVMDPQTRDQLQQSKEELESQAPIPPQEVYAFVEGFLAHHGFFLSPIKGGSRPMLGVYPINLQQSRAPSYTPLTVDAAQLAELDAHPALLVRVVVLFQNIDSRQLQTQLRQLLVDNSGTRQCVPLGERGLLLQGLGRDTASLVRLLREVDAATPPQPPALPAAEAEAGAR